MLCLLRKAVKALVILIPLLGSTYLIFITPVGDDRVSRTIFSYSNAIIQSTQVSQPLLPTSVSRGQAGATLYHHWVRVVCRVTPFSPARRRLHGRPFS